MANGAVATDKAGVRVDPEREKEEILNRYRGLLRAIRGRRSPEDTRQIRKAFNLAVEAHKDQRRKSGEPYIYHPIAVARICAEEIGLGATGVVAALLHDTVEDTDLTLDDIRDLFGPTVATIIDGLTKIGGMQFQTDSLQAENFRKVLLTLSEDIRVILIKMADRLHNMRTLDSMARDKQLKIASETLFLYAPLAHRLGLYSIKTELEDLALKFKEPAIYEEIALKLKKGEAVRRRFISRFILPIREALDREGFEYTIKGRPKSIHSIYNKMLKKHVSFEEVYDVFAIRIIIESRPENEKADCWKVYSVVTDFYQPNPDRLRDWISIPKVNGYESLHTTVMSPGGRWVEVQIRTSRMDEVAEMGLAAHYRYKDDEEHASALDTWLTRVREVLEDVGSSAVDFVHDFKLDLFSDEIVVFTPKGEMRNLPTGATALDFAFEIHTQVGRQCIGAKVNHRLVPLSQPLKSGDQIEIITSKKQQPKEDWLNFVITGKARNRIKQSLREQKRKLAVVGRDMVQRQFRKWGAKADDQNIQALVDHFRANSVTDLHYQVARGRYDLEALEKPSLRGGRIVLPKRKASSEDRSLEEVVREIRGGDQSALLIGDDLQKIDYKLSPCCNPIPGDDVFGFITINDGIKIHRVNCPNAVQLMSNFAYRIVKARWKGKDTVEFLAGIKFSGIDDVGLVNKITSIISHEHNVNMRAISFESHDGIFEGKVMAFVHDTDHLDVLMDKLRRVNGVRSVERVDH
ncbi:MAG TPA: bifunctional (p)ppGpp synthetase/guanosine-3',5'-bis(diphosphate) 3'-pyrophosphohydrolase [Flavobacteriales bacterium]|nr:bifunctional (p)ppGpp synthetase/guanosine-3',5'-bis(diphosphate) 3'-pyrophosphohydrolase [Flavobacteriales bacterium]MCB9198888.1 bifunctional (p)ppGpp synthetase/guanosine-3',5'-bis(diphosphate) 3'-pyrophosphohydrolase [Flavobacteriales bacterium]HOP42480.1 bifunctional (p)ppGpp synthetase/guanosine-3',5'-bis(diphosphate) 3'-pyrophosphohydrolase [Flavobacteriales bacterium]HPQ57562.1 bifunctional (p)ppGpp synthetase/guanosine-3',5'-bis(diphosphate) 3'-pyrophosphohydrolase [Flavobacteriales 